jgi:hypothetical protein
MQLGRTSSLFIRKRGENKMQFYRIIKACSLTFVVIVTASFFLMTSAEAKVTCNFFTGFADNKDGTVTDTRNGLIWKRCAEGYDFTNGVCTGEGTKANWEHAMLIAEQSRYLDESNWRLPTMEEFEAVLGSYDECKSYKGYAASKAIAHNAELFWSADKRRNVNFGNGGHGSCSGSCGDERAFVRLVRSGEMLGGKATLEFVNERAADEALAARQRKEEEAQQRKEEQKLAAFRRSLREGDDTSSGVVIQVKGNLIKIQTNDSQCSQKDYDGNCKNWINTPVEKWFKRSEVYPK